MSEYFRRSAKERSAEGQARAVARGAAPWARVPVGYFRRDDGTYAVDPERAAIVVQAYELRAAGASIAKVRAILNDHGITRSHHGVQQMLSSRAYLGEIHFGKLVNLNAHEPIIGRDLWRRVQQMVLPRGRSSSSDRLLARLGVLRCGSCGARLCAMKMPRQNDYPIYRCPSTSDCPRHVTISAVIAETVVSDAVRDALSDAVGRASAVSEVHEAERALEHAQDELDAAVRTFTATGLTDEASAHERLAELREVRDAARDRVEQLGGRRAAVAVTTAADWDRLSLDARRGLIRATVDRVTVAPGRGPDRVTVELLGE